MRLPPRSLRASWATRRASPSEQSMIERITAGHRQPPVVPLVHPGENRRPGWRTRGHSSIGVRQIRPLLSQFVEIGRFQHRMPSTTQAVAALLLGGDEQ